jgi:glycerate dehydrogenase
LVQAQALEIRGFFSNSRIETFHKPTNCGGGDLSLEQIVFLERGTFRVEFRRPDFHHEWRDHAVTDPAEVVTRLRHATIAIINKLALRKSDLRQLPQLKMIAVAATGVDNLDLDYCEKNGIAVCNVRNYAVNSLAEHVLMLILALRRNLVGYHEDVKRGEWQRAKQFCLIDRPVHDVSGTTLTVVGYGFLGKTVAKLAQAVGMRVLLSERKGEATVRDGRVPFKEALARADIVTLHCPLTAETKDLIGAPEFQLMKSSALLINTARGGLVNEEALLSAIKNGTIAGAAVDVLSREPPTEGNVLLDEDLPNLIVTPHIAWSSREAMKTLADQLIDNLEAFKRGERLNRVV